ncbi:MAG: methylene-tetrahydromethanopterin dehydrogenase N-terminal domain-containing protein [Desulfurococcaceae archaeon]
MSTQERKLAILFLDTDKHVSPFEPLLVTDLFPNANLFLYSNVEPEDVVRIVQDAMFPRGPKGVKYTKMFIGGYDVEKVEKIVEIIKKTMFPPFEFTVIVDPRGANTTAAAAVAKTLELSLKHNLGDFRNKNVTILAGTGPVGVVAATIYALEGANVIITSRSQEKALKTAQKINKEVGTDRVKGVRATTREEVGEAIREANVILATGAAGVRLLELETLRKYGEKCNILADVNAVPPTGIEGLDPSDEDKEVLPGVHGVGALRIGALKNRILADLFKLAAETPKGILDYKAAYEIAKQTIKPR